MARTGVDIPRESALKLIDLYFGIGYNFKEDSQTQSQPRYESGSHRGRDPEAPYGDSRITIKLRRSSQKVSMNIKGSWTSFATEVGAISEDFRPRTEDED